jgi:hypothetical protein
MTPASFDFGPLLSLTRGGGFRFLAAQGSLPTWALTLTLTLPGVVLLLVLGMLFASRRRTEANLHTLAERLGFQIKPVNAALGIIPMPPTVTGQYHGRAVRFLSHHVLGEKNQLWMAVAATAQQPPGASLHVATNCWFIRATFSTARLSARWDGDKMIKGWATPKLQNTRTDDASFDEAFLVRASEAEWAKTILTPKVRDELLASRAQAGPLLRLRVEAGEVRYSVRGNFNRPDRVNHLVAQMDFVCQLAEQIETLMQRQRAFIPSPV